MTWPLLLVIGLVLIAALISVAYIIWLQSSAGYRELQVANDAVSIIADVYLTDGDATPTASPSGTLAGHIVVYRDTNLQSPWQLADQLKAKIEPTISDDPAKKFEAVTVVKDPGYNSFRVYHKNKDLLVYAYKAWTNSVFHALVMPIEILLRASLFPLWTMIDFVSHERRVVAGLVLYPELASRPETVSLIEDCISIVEAYDALYVRMTDCKMFRFDCYAKAKTIDLSAAAAAASQAQILGSHDSNGQTSTMDRWLSAYKVQQ